ncbi:hypothetical protein LY76DRAFT_599384 [Colletotrichum caudatum]|nr:hypothetical protein LY76DRAFT_599384 [Colletotrichum caudatum]
MDRSRPLPPPLACSPARLLALVSCQEPGVGTWKQPQEEEEDEEEEEEGVDDELAPAFPAFCLSAHVLCRRLRLS